ncbi:MAG: leucine-rich repeat protein [Clostridia bacterium]|nr:leucine-rich repeat protein [Clostridia bacterium]
MTKKFLLALSMVAVLSLLLAISVFAVDVTVNELSYTLTEDDNTATIKKHENNSFTNTSIVIPEYVEYEGEKYYVTKMADYTFKCSNITSVRFDDNCGIKVIPTQAFYDCNSLTLIDFGQAKITTLGEDAFAFCESLVFKDNKLPVAFKEFSGIYQFRNCYAMTTLIFPESFTYFNTDTRIQDSGIYNLVFLGKMTYVYLQYSRKESLGGFNIYLCNNTISELNGDYVNDTTIYNNEPYFKNVRGEYTTKTDGTLTFLLSNNNQNSNTPQATINDVKYSRVNKSQDRIYFCKENKVSYVVRTDILSGGWTGGYFATYDANALELTAESNPNEAYKLVPHIAEREVNIPAQCEIDAATVTYCFCGSEMSRVSVEGTALSHDYDYVNGNATLVSISYASYTAEGKKIVTCANCGENGTHKAPALFICNGYSAPENGAGGIAIGFTVNNKAIAEYEGATNKTIKYGIFAVLQSKLGDNKIFGEDGNVADGAIIAEITNHEFAAFELKIVGFADEIQKSTQIAMGAYVEVIDGEATEYTYIQGKKPEAGYNYHYASYNDIVSSIATGE